MGDVSQFMKLVKQRFSIWFNKSHQRYGTLSRGEVAAANSAAEWLVSTHSTFVDGWLLMAVVLARQGKDDDSKAALRRVQDLGGFDPEVLKKVQHLFRHAAART